MLPHAGVLSVGSEMRWGHCTVSCKCLATSVSHG